MALIAVEVNDWTGIASEHVDPETDEVTVDPSFRGTRIRETRLVFDTYESALAVQIGLIGDPALKDEKVGRLCTFQYPRTPSGSHYTVCLEHPLPSRKEGEEVRPCAWTYEGKVHRTSLHPIPQKKVTS